MIGARMVGYAQVGEDKPADPTDDDDDASTIVAPLAA